METESLLINRVQPYFEVITKKICFAFLQTQQKITSKIYQVDELKHKFRLLLELTACWIQQKSTLVVGVLC